MRTFTKKYNSSHNTCCSFAGLCPHLCFALANWHTSWIIGVFREGNANDAHNLFEFFGIQGFYAIMLLKTASFTIVAILVLTDFSSSQSSYNQDVSQSFLEKKNNPFLIEICPLLNSVCQRKCAESEGIGSSEMGILRDYREYGQNNCGGELLPVDRENIFNF